jgi:putative copper export protein
MIYGVVFVLMRWLHIGSAAIAVGGLAMIVLCAGPARRLFDQPDMAEMIRRIDFRMRLVFALAVVGLLVSGVYQWVVLGQAYQEAGTVANVLLSIKVLLATAFFTSLWAFGVDSMAHPKAKRWRLINLHLAVAVLMLAGVLRYVRLHHGL